MRLASPLSSPLTFMSGLTFVAFLGGWIVTTDLLLQKRSEARNVPICGGSAVNCVVDGDTFILGDEKIRIQTVDAPEMKGRCNHEINLALKSRARLSQLLSSDVFRVTRSGTDQYGRTLAFVENSRGDVGAQLASEGLARAWDGKRYSWC